MSVKSKEVIKGFYKSDILKDSTILKRFLHPEITLYWNSADGLTIMKYDEILAFYNEISRNYTGLRAEVSHLLADENFVTVRYKYFVRTMENPDEELAIAHFISIWEVKDDKIYRGHQVSQPVTDKDDTQGSYQRIKV